ncbi:DTW domain-containing protein 2 [Daphnia magna]|uniref:tRNA-uridine aminocarboxypropyltransferase n=1 Tax=Daphnia magna TaxID=35525 RepID=A0A164JYW7_9CRUS|nr:DTW domain-containing protein 2 [Daphnia magna]
MDQDFIQFADEIVLGESVQRSSCSKCRRPERVCWCSYLPKVPVTINGKIIVLQHPDEEKRNLKTGPMLFHGMASGQCIIYYGKKFPSAKHEGLKEMLEEQYTYVLYPGPQSRSITTVSDIHPKGAPYNLVLIDGTWQQAKSMYFHSTFLHSLPQVDYFMFYIYSYIVSWR